MTEFASPSPTERLLLQEWAHRISNEFTSIINAIACAEMRCSHPEVKVALNEAMEILHSCADLHSALRMPRSDGQTNAAEYLHRLCVAVSRSKLQQVGITLVLDSAPLTLGPESTWYLGLIVYELVTNAARHAFGDREGKFASNSSAPTSSCNARLRTMDRDRRISNQVKGS
jgi:two-component sensor histidine kinase